MKMDSDSDSDDSDYKDEDEQVSGNYDDDNKNRLENLPIEELSHRRKRIVDDIWNEMNKIESEEVHKKMKTSFKPFYQQNVFKTKFKVSNSNNVKDMLKSIFGSTSGSKSSNENVINISDDVESNAVKDEISNAVKSLKHQGKVVEKVKFAGQEILVKVDGKSEINTKKKAASSTTTNIDNVLESLKGPKTISTVTKSSIDWDNFKEQEGIQDMLQVASKDGYLNRQEFLGRCDVRAFENEREARERVRQQQTSTTSTST